jgi:hypothetical protein
VERILMKTNRILKVAMCAALAVAVPVSCEAEGKDFSKIAGVDNTSMGAYRALADLTFQAFQKGDAPTAAKLARILEMTWDKGENDLKRSNSNLWRDIDQAMDGFIAPVMNYAAQPANPVDIKTLYRTYLEALKKADRPREG